MTAFALIMAGLALIAARIAAFWQEAWRAEVDRHTAECLRRIEYAQAQRRITHGGRK